MSPPLGALVIRKARLDDLGAILALQAEDRLHPEPSALAATLARCYRDAFVEIDRDPNQLLAVAEFDGKVVGTFQLTFLRYLSYEGALAAQVENVRVTKASRGRGIGAEMMRFAIAEAERRGANRVQLTSNKQRADAHRFYERLGFSRSHEGFKKFLGS